MNNDDSANNDPIGSALNMTPMPYDPVQKLMGQALDDSAQTDFTQARANIMDLISKGTESFDKLSMIAEASQHPRAFEVLSTMFNSLIEANKELLDLQLKIRKIDDAGKVSNDEARVINNNLFVSTAELHKMLKSIPKDE
jgi:hypothetical protein